MKIITTIILLILCSLCFANSSQAASDSATQHLYLTILPAFESVELGETTTETPLTITKTKVIGVRSNTPWDLQVSPSSFGFVNSAYCNTNGTIGQSNGDAGVGDNFQFVSITCVQPKSWGDQNGATLSINYIAGGGFSF